MSLWTYQLAMNSRAFLLLASWWLFHEYSSSWARSQDLAVCCSQCVWDMLTYVAVRASGCWTKNGFCLGLRLFSPCLRHALSWQEGLAAPCHGWSGIWRGELPAAPIARVMSAWSAGGEGSCEASSGVESWILVLCGNFVVVLTVLSLVLFNPYCQFGLRIGNLTLLEVYHSVEVMKSRTPALPEAAGRIRGLVFELVPSPDIRLLPFRRLPSPSGAAFLNLRALYPFEKSPKTALSFHFTCWVLPSGPS